MIEQEDGGRGIKRPRHERHNRPRILGESIRHAKARDKDESAPEREEEVRDGITVKLRDGKRKTHAQAAYRQTQTPGQIAQSGPVAVEQGADGQSRDVRRRRRQAEEEV